MVRKLPTRVQVCSELVSSIKNSGWKPTVCVLCELSQQVHYLLTELLFTCTGKLGQWAAKLL